MKKKILWGILLLFIAIQFIRPARNISDEITQNDLTQQYNISTDITDLLDKACNDCHSNNTYYPWYANVQPIGWWLQHHVDEGKRELNFSEFGSYSPRKQDHKLEELIELVEKGAMPLSSYTLVHHDAKLSDEEKKTLTGWAKRLRTEIAVVK
jgi:hypothetical protein